nr:tripartite tricarboxylate transporter substrate-binding protein [Bradyrhizobium neotropicale]
MPYRGDAQSVTALLGGEVAVIVGRPVLLAPQIQSGAIRGLAVTSRTRTDKHGNRACGSREAVSLIPGSFFAALDRRQPLITLTKSHWLLTTVSVLRLRTILACPFLTGAAIHLRVARVMFRLPKSLGTPGRDRGFLGRKRPGKIRQESGPKLPGL